VNIFDRTCNPTGHCIQWNDVEQTLIFPVVFLYPEYGQTDYIQEFPETTTYGQEFDDISYALNIVRSRLFEQISMMFSSLPPWDDERKYTLDRIHVRHFSN
jgi:hypothetical protein